MWKAGNWCSSAVSPSAWPACKCRDVGGGELGAALEALLEPADRGRPVALEHPVDQAQRVEVLAAQLVARGEAAVAGGGLGVGRDIDLDHPVAVEGAVLARVRGEVGLAQAALVEAALVEDHHATGLQLRQIDLQGGGVEGHQHVGTVAHGVDVPGAEIDLEGRDAEGRADRCADLGREVGEGLEVVAGQCRRQGELRAGQLHAVAAVTREADDGGFELAPDQRHVVDQIHGESLSLNGLRRQACRRARAEPPAYFTLLEKRCRVSYIA